MSINLLKHSEQELLNIHSQVTPAGSNYSGAQTNTVVITPTDKDKIICIVGLAASIVADGTFSLNDNATSPATVYPTTTLKAGWPLVISGVTIYRGVAGNNVRLTSSGSISLMLWYYEDLADATAPVFNP